jgi:hypothetical protein
MAAGLVGAKVDVIIAMGGTPFGAGSEKRNVDGPDLFPATSPGSTCSPSI